MLIVTIAVDAPVGQALAVKEVLAQQLEQLGDTRVLSVAEKRPEQLSLYQSARAGGPK